PDQAGGQVQQVVGLARVVRGYVTPVMEGMALWHERDISHSSVERVALPDAAIATDYLLHLTTGLIGGLRVDAARMRANLELTGGLIYTSSVLLDLVEAGMSREDAYALVQAAAAVTWDTGTSFRETLRKEAAAAGQALDETRLAALFGPENADERHGAHFGRLGDLTGPGANPGHTRLTCHDGGKAAGLEGCAMTERKARGSASTPGPDAGNDPQTPKPVEYWTARTRGCQVSRQLADRNTSV